MFDAKKTKNQIVKWIAEYFLNNASAEAKAIIGISGGKDSSVAAALCAEALGKERVFGVLMPQDLQPDIDMSYALCEELGIKFAEINIGCPTQALYKEINRTGLALNSIATVNTPGRIRMATLYAVCGILGGRVVNTCNLSEEWVGYSTKFGDSAGDFSPLSELTVTEVKAVGYETGLPKKFIDKTPIDGLCGKTDEENLGFAYVVLDKYIREGVCGDPKVKDRIDMLHKQNLHKLNPMPTFRFNEA